MSVERSQVLNAFTAGPAASKISPALLVSHFHVYSTVALDGLSIVTLLTSTSFRCASGTAYSSLPSLFFDFFTPVKSARNASPLGVNETGVLESEISLPILRYPAFSNKRYCGSRGWSTPLTTPVWKRTVMGLCPSRIAATTELASAVVSTFRLWITKYMDTPTTATIRETIRSSGMMDEVFFSISISCSNIGVLQQISGVGIIPRLVYNFAL